MVANSENSGALAYQKRFAKKLAQKQASLDLGVPVSALKRGSPKSQRVAGGKDVKKRAAQLRKKGQLD